MFKRTPEAAKAMIDSYLKNQEVGGLGYSDVVLTSFLKFMCNKGLTNKDCQYVVHILDVSK